MTLQANSCVVDAAATQPSTPVRKDWTLKEAFGIDVPYSVSGFAQHDWAPVKDPNYKFNKENLSDLLNFHASGETAFLAVGHKGTGKTSMVEQFHASLCLPLLIVSCSRNMTEDQLVGQWLLTEDKSMNFKLTGVALAAQLGMSVLLEEYNLLPPGVASVLNQLLEGKPYDVPQTSERIIPAPGFKVFATMNPNDGMNYRDREDLDSANEDRFFIVQVGYLPEEDEIPIVEGALAAITDSEVRKNMAKGMVDVANKIRAQFMQTSAAALTTVMSTRTLRRWAKFSLIYRSAASKGKSPLHVALSKVLTNAPSVSAADRQAIHEIVVSVLDQEYRV
ncbi:AAA domain-containing protein [Chromobacterium haemolyticum]|uniref:AAA domain-containing protein n=1 Tax=Chromobacterium fluminis TaxID=3044269 RepID=A0ABX0L0C2_9NEIS|nr:AAA family ATPase [Chromobacterium haemolyticum]NHR04516.1 AAA domain-containing protein [Chromobacterium haemolyticum]